MKKRLIALSVTLGILGLILAKIDRAELARNLRETRLVPFLIALALFAPQNFVSIWRWRSMASHFTPMTWRNAAGLILAGQAMNVVLPSKMGDLAKGVFLHRSGALDLARATNLVVFEKMLDLASLCLLAVVGVGAAYAFGVPHEDPVVFAALAGLTGALGLAILTVVVCLYFVPTRSLPFYDRLVAALGSKPKLKPLHDLFASSHEVMSLLQAKHARRGLICAASVGLWALHMLQIRFFFAALGLEPPLLAYWSLMPLAIFAGLLPISLFGVGVRDSAIIFLFAPYHPAAALAGVGLYVNLRYIVPALTGLPFLGRYMALAKRPA